MSHDNEEFPGVRKALFRFRTYNDADVTREEQYMAGQYFEGLPATEHVLLLCNFRWQDFGQERC